MNGTCFECKFMRQRTDLEPCEYCTNVFAMTGVHPNFEVKRKTITHYDRLVRKTPEEMAKYIAAEQISSVRTFLNGFDQELEEEFANEVNEHWHEIVREKLEWLNQEVEEKM